jgi:hypothetical protein
MRLLLSSMMPPCMLAGAVLLIAAVSTGEQRTYAQTPEPTFTPELLRAPSEVRLNFGPESRLVTWVDNTMNEEGYRVEVTIIDETRVFELPPNAVELRIPDDFAGGCGAVRVLVIAFLGDMESEPGSAELSTTCPPDAPTATAGPTVAPSGLPGTGSGPDGGHIEAAVALAAGAAAALACGGALLMRRR